MFCGSCGAKNEQAETQLPPESVIQEPELPKPTQIKQAAPPQSAQAKKAAPVKKKKTALTAIVAAAVVVIGVAVYFLFIHGDGGGLGARAIPDEERIKSDIETNGHSPIAGIRTVDDVDIISYETDTDVGIHSAYVRVYSNDSEIAFSEVMTVSYGRNEEREWVLSSVVPDNSMPVLMSPLIGAREELAREAILGAVLIIDEDEWIVNENSLETFSIASQETNLEQNRDIITANVELRDTVLSAEGQMQVEFRFNNGVWEYSEYRVSTPFTTEVMPHAVLELTDDELLAVISRNDVLFSASTATEFDRLLDQATADIAGALLGMPFLSLLGGSHDPTAQSISFDPDEVSDFSVLYSTVSDKGTTQTFYSYFVLHKELATIGVNARVTYRYDAVSGWVVEDTAFVSRIVAVANLAGTRWIGTAADLRHQQRSKQFILDITEFNEDGTMRAVFNYPGEQRSGTLTGFFDTNRLSATFIFDEWIQIPLNPFGRPYRVPDVGERIHRINLDGYLFLDELVLRSPFNIGSGDSFGFSVTFDSRFDVSELDEAHDDNYAEEIDTDDAHDEDDENGEE